jgi:hypothetical protein
MSNKNQYILLMTTFILIIIVGYYYVIYIGETPIVGPRKLVVEIQTDSDAYVLGEDIEISVYLYNDRLRPVRIEQRKLIVETPVWIRPPLSDVSMIHYIEGSSMTVPARSRVLWGKTTFEPRSTGYYTIECLGEKVTIKVVFLHEDTTL